MISIVSALGLFSRQPRSVAPGNLGEMLSEWGRWEFDPSTRPEGVSETGEFILGLQFRRGEVERTELIREIRETGLREGGWTVYGAWDAIAFLDPVPEEVLEELSEARVRFLLSLNLPDLGLRLNTFDSLTLQRIDPEEYARISPT